MPEVNRRKKQPELGEKVKCVVCGKKMDTEHSVMTDDFIFCHDWCRKIQAEEQERNAS